MMAPFLEQVLCLHSLDSPCVCVRAHLCLTLYDPWTVACQAPLSMGFPMVRILEWVAVSFSRGSSWPRVQTCVSCIGRRILYHWATRDCLVSGGRSEFLSESFGLDCFQLEIIFMPKRDFRVANFVPLQLYTFIPLGALLVSQRMKRTSSQPKLTFQIK